MVNTSTAGPEFHGPFGWGRTYPEYTIDNATLADVTDLVQEDGTITVDPTLVPTAQRYLLQAYYAGHSYSREVQPWSASPKTIFQNGSLATDHFSASGAKVITDFLEEYVLDDESKDLFREVGHYFWEDSVEIEGRLYWTPGLEERFQREFKVSAAVFTQYSFLIGDTV